MADVACQNHAPVQTRQSDCEIHRINSLLYSSYLPKYGVMSNGQRFADETTVSKEGSSSNLYSCEDGESSVSESEDEQSRQRARERL